MATMRSIKGDLTIAIVALALLGAVVVAGVSSYSEYTIVKKDIDSAVKNTKGYILNRIRNDLTETIIEQNPAAAQAMLAGILADARNNARDNLGPASTAYLASRNPGDLSAIFNNSFIGLNSGIISFQVVARAAVSMGFPTVYETRTKIISGTLKELIAIFDSGLSFDCDADCGACGQCDSRTNQCIGVSKVIDGTLMTPDSPVNGKFACKDFSSSLNGQQCLELGGLIQNENGADVCVIGSNCKFRENIYAWNTNNSTSTADVIFDSSTIASDIDIALTSHDAVVAGETKRFTRGDRFAFANNTKDADSPTYAVCEESASKRIFLTSNLFHGDLMTIVGIIGGPGVYTAVSNGVEAADMICKLAAGNAGLADANKFIAFISSGNLGIDARDRIDGEAQIEDVHGNIIHSGGPGNNFWDGASMDLVPIYDQNGTAIHPIGNRYIWTGTLNNGQGISSGPYALHSDCDAWSDNTFGGIPGRIQTGFGGVHYFFHTTTGLPQPQACSINARLACIDED